MTRLRQYVLLFCPGCESSWEYEAPVYCPCCGELIREWKRWMS